MFKNKSFSVFLLITLITIGLYAIGSIAIIYAINMNMKQLAYTEAVNKAQIILDRNLATHSYYSQVLKPDLFESFENMDTDPEFDPVWMSSTYAIREINEIFYDLREGNSSFYYKEAAINARSPENEADYFEADFLYELNIDESLTDKNEVRNIDGVPFLTILRRGEQMEESCLQCHSTPDVAPAGLVEIYGPDRSFNRSVDEVISAISIRIPLAVAYENANRISLILALILLFLLGIIVAAQIFINRRLMFKPISNISRTASSIAHDQAKLGDQIKGHFGREIKDLVQSFNTMSNILKKDRDNLEKKVKERSQELTEVNSLLKQDIERRKEAEEQLKKEKNKVDRINLELEQEIAERKKIEKYIRSLAYHDNLTGLPNRILFYDRIGIAVADAKRNHKKFAVLLFDIDNFKKVNDSMGHDKGDALLRCVASTVKETIRESDTSARLGGDEFIMLVNDIKTEEDAFRVAEKILYALKEVGKKNPECDFVISVSIGISIYPDDGTDVNTLIKNADIAMYNVKRRGKNAYKRFDETMIDEINS